MKNKTAPPCKNNLLSLLFSQDVKSIQHGKANDKVVQRHVSTRSERTTSR